MIEQVMIYEVKSSATSNAKELFSNDLKYFYWNEARFKNLKIGDFVFVINRIGKWVLFTRLDKTDIPAEEEGNSTNFQDSGKSFNVNGKWNRFIRLIIIEKHNIPDNWQWQNLGNSETTYLNGSRIDPKLSNNRIKNITQLKELSNDPLFTNVLNSCISNFKSEFFDKDQVKKDTTNVTEEMDYKNILLAIKTKPFILLAGISGTGKSRLVRTLAYKTCSKKELRIDPRKPGNFELIPVRPNWHDSSELMGYVSRINGEKYIITTFLRFLAKAWQNVEIPFFLCLDEMNLAPVEQYFAEYLSIIETRLARNGEITTDFLISKASFENKELYSQLMRDLGLDNDTRFEYGIGIPKNLVVIGTVNMDETTHSFSRKVLDRAMTFEMNNVNLNSGLDNTKNDWSYPIKFIQGNEVVGQFTSGTDVFNDSFKERDHVIEFLKKLNNELEGTPFKFAYRTRDEFLVYCYHASLHQIDSNWFTSALDEMTTMKILSRIEGDETKTDIVLTNLQRVLTSDYKKSNAKLKEMENRLQSSGYTSFWS